MLQARHQLRCNELLLQYDAVQSCWLITNSFPLMAQGPIWAD
jgi:hypothetical protein